MYTGSMIDIAQGLLCDHIVSCNVQTELKQTFVSPESSVSPFSSTAPYSQIRFVKQQQRRRHLPEMFLIKPNIHFQDLVSSIILIHVHTSTC